MMKYYHSNNLVWNYEDRIDQHKQPSLHIHPIIYMI